jgi:hypothetical protein
MVSCVTMILWWRLHACKITAVSWYCNISFSFFKNIKHPISGSQKIIISFLNINVTCRSTDCQVPSVEKILGGDEILKILGDGKRVKTSQRLNLYSFWNSHPVNTKPGILYSGNFNTTEIGWSRNRIFLFREIQNNDESDFNSAKFRCTFFREISYKLFREIVSLCKFFKYQCTFREISYKLFREIV